MVVCVGLLDRRAELKKIAAGLGPFTVLSSVWRSIKFVHPQGRPQLSVLFALCLTESEGKKMVTNISSLVYLPY